MGINIPEFVQQKLSFATVGLMITPQISQMQARVCKAVLNVSLFVTLITQKYILTCAPTSQARLQQPHNGYRENLNIMQQPKTVIITLNWVNGMSHPTCCNRNKVMQITATGWVLTRFPYLHTVPVPSWDLRYYRQCTQGVQFNFK